MTPDDEMVIRMLHLHLDKNKLYNVISTQLVNECIAENEIDNLSIYYIVDQNIDLYSYIKQHKSKWMEKENFMPPIPGG